MAAYSPRTKVDVKEEISGGHPRCVPDPGTQFFAGMATLARPKASAAVIRPEK